MLTVISTMLIFSGIGSMFSGKAIGLLRNSVYTIYIIIAALTLLIGLLNSTIFEAFVRAEVLWRVVISIVLIAPLAFFMGIPFPYGMSRIDDNSKYLAAYSWGVNSFFSVIGSVLAVILSMSFGFRIVFAISAVVYLGAMVTVKTLKPAEQKMS
jgi:hypothetical protein